MEAFIGDYLLVVKQRLQSEAGCEKRILTFIAENKKELKEVNEKYNADIRNRDTKR